MPVFRRIFSPWPAAATWSQRSAARAHCHTTASPTGSPVIRFHAREVSRWLLIPTPATLSLSICVSSSSLAVTAMIF